MEEEMPPHKESRRARREYSGRRFMSEAWVRKDIIGEAMPARHSVLQGPNSDYDQSTIEPSIWKELCRDELDLFMPAVWYSLNKRRRWENVHRLNDVAALSDERRFVSTAVFDLPPNSYPHHSQHHWDAQRDNDKTNAAREYHAVLSRGTDEAEEVHRSGKRHGTHMDVLMKTEGKRRCRAGKCRRVGCPLLHAGDKVEVVSKMEKDAIAVEYNVARVDASDDRWRKAARLGATYQSRDQRGGNRRHKAAHDIADARDAMLHEEDDGSAQVLAELPDTTPDSTPATSVNLADCLVSKKKTARKGKKARRPVLNLMEPFDWTITDGEVESDEEEVAEEETFVLVDADPFIVHDVRLATE